MLCYLLASIPFNKKGRKPYSSNPSGGGFRFLLVLIAGIVYVVRCAGFAWMLLCLTARKFQEIACGLKSRQGSLARGSSRELAVPRHAQLKISLQRFNSKSKRHRHLFIARYPRIKERSHTITERWQTSIATARAAIMEEDEVITRESEVAVRSPFMHRTIGAKVHKTDSIPHRGRRFRPTAVS